MIGTAAFLRQFGVSTCLGAYWRQTGRIPTGRKFGNVWTYTEEEAAQAKAYALAHVAHQKADKETPFPRSSDERPASTQL